MASTATNIIPIDSGTMRISKPLSSATSSPVGSRVAESFTHFSEDIAFRTITDASQPSTNARLSQTDLYPDRHAFSSQHITALRLLRLAVGRLQRAMAALAQGDEVNADSETQRVQVILPELYCCRTLGAGFDTLVNALMSAFESLGGASLNVGQVRALVGICVLLLDKPFLNADEADRELDKLEAVNLNPYPPELVEFLSHGEGVR